MFGTPDKSFEARFLALRHDSHQLVLGQPGRAGGHAQMAPEFKHRDVVLRLGQQLRGQKPHAHGQLRVLKNARGAGSSSDAGE